MEETLRAMPWRRRLLIVVLTLATTFTVVSMLLAPPGGARHTSATVSGPPADTPACQPAAASGAVAEACVGAITRVLPARQP